LKAIIKAREAQESRLLQQIADETKNTEAEK